MSIRFKSVSVALALLLLVIPTVALASCSQGMRMSGVSDSDMMGMAMPPIGASVSAQPNGTCCVVVPAELKSAWLPKPDSPTAALITVPTLPQSSATIPRTVAALTLPAATPPTQAFLCVFLI